LSPGDGTKTVTSNFPEAASIQAADAAWRVVMKRLNELIKARSRQIFEIKRLTQGNASKK